LKKENKILILISRITFFSYFAAWSLTSFLFMQQANCSFPVQDESYLLNLQVTGSFFNGIEENKKLRNSGDNESRFLYSLNPGTAGLNILCPSGNYHFIIPEDIPAISEVYLSNYHPRPPPFFI
jgi:hypothetical protein